MTRSDGAPAPAGATFPRPVLLLTNYRGGGIGDFGQNLARHLSKALGTALESVETTPSGRGAFADAVAVAASRKDVIANVGLTGWGASGVRNLTGFLGIGAHRLGRRRTIVIVHHAIEMFAPQESGYTLTPLVRAGAHWALRRVRHCDLVAFSPVVERLLRERYGARSVTLVPLPCELPRVDASGEDPGHIVTAGYLAPYKGLDLFLDVAEAASDRRPFVLAGRPHPILEHRIEFRAQLDRWSKRARALGVTMPGYLDDDALSSLLAGRSVGVLAYTSASGASASFSIFAERGIPVVATDLPEFRFLQAAGAGVVLVPPTAAGVAAAVGRLVADPTWWTAQSLRQRAFSEQNDWRSFVARLGALLSGPPTDP